jgi:methylglutaconyl-CoA hydratase
MSNSLDRPDLHNAFNEEVIAEITDFFMNRENGPNPEKHRGVVLTGAGKSFSAGADLNWMKKMATYTEEQNRDDAYKLSDMFREIRRCPVPVIGRINGTALGGGLSAS